MSGLSSDEILQFTAWFITLIELLVGVYILVLNPRHSANRLVGITLVLISINTYAVAVLLGTHTVSEAKPAAIFLAITSLSIKPLLLLTTVALLKLEFSAVS